MAKLKKVAAFLTAAIMASSFAGCADTSYTIKADEEEIRAGIYIDYMLNEMSYQMSMLYYMEGITEDYFGQEIEGKPFAEHISEQALKNTKEYAAITKQFDVLGLELEEDKLKEVNTQVKEAWDGQSDLFEKEGISKESLKEVYMCSAKREVLFDYYYAEGGVEAVSADEMQTYVNDNYLRFKTITIAKSTDEDEAAAAAADEESLSLRDEYFAKADGLSFDEFDSVIDEYNAYVESLTSDGTETDPADENPSQGEDETTETDSIADVDSETSDENPADSEEETSDTDDTDADNEEETSGTDTDADNDEDSDTADEIPADGEDENLLELNEAEAEYVNESMVNFGSYEEEELESDYGKMLSEISSMSADKAIAYEDDTAYYIIIKGDVAQRTDYIEDNTDTLLSEMKSDEFQVKIDSWVEAIKFTKNEKALKRYTPQVVYDKQNEYYETMQGG